MRSDVGGAPERGRYIESRYYVHSAVTDFLFDFFIFFFFFFFFFKSCYCPKGVFDAVDSRDRLFFFSRRVWHAVLQRI
jgi:hypothetical protein